MNAYGFPATPIAQLCGPARGLSGFLYFNIVQTAGQHADDPLAVIALNFDRAVLNRSARPTCSPQFLTEQRQARFVEGKAAHYGDALSVAAPGLARHANNSIR
jgi:hypothetical protein